MIIIKSAEPNSATDLIDMEIEVNGEKMNATMPYETAIAFKDYVLKDYDDRFRWTDLSGILKNHYEYISNVFHIDKAFYKFTQDILDT